MQALNRFFISHVSSKPSPLKTPLFISLPKTFSTSNTTDDTSSGTDWSASFGRSDSEKFGWDSGSSSWSTGLTAQHFDGEKVGQQTSPPSQVQEPARAQAQAQAQYKVGGYDSTQMTTDELAILRKLDEENRKGKLFVDGWEKRLKETNVLMKQIREPGARGSYLKDSEKAEMYKKHKEDPEVYTVEKLAKEYRIMRQRVLAILLLKEFEEEEEKKLGRKLDDTFEVFCDTCPQFFNFHDREYHVASLPYKPEFSVMPEGWDGTTRDLDEVHYEISKKEDEMLYQEFARKLAFNKMKMKGEVNCHRYSRRRSSEGWKITVEKLGPRGKRGDGGGLKFVSAPDGSSRPLEDKEKMYVKRETSRHRRKILP